MAEWNSDIDTEVSNRLTSAANDIRVMRKGGNPDAVAAAARLDQLFRVVYLLNSEEAKLNASWAERAITLLSRLSTDATVGWSAREAEQLRRGEAALRAMADPGLSETGFATARRATSRVLSKLLARASRPRAADAAGWEGGASTYSSTRMPRAQRSVATAKSARKAVAEAAAPASAAASSADILEPARREVEDPGFSLVPPVAAAPPTKGGFFFRRKKAEEAEAEAESGGEPEGIAGLGGFGPRRTAGRSALWDIGPSASMPAGLGYAPSPEEYLRRRAR